MQLQITRPIQHNIQILKELPNNATMCIISQLNEIITKETIPDRWRLAKITVLTRDSNTSNLPQLYRPISLLDTLYKTLSAILRALLGSVVSDPTYYSGGTGVSPVGGDGFSERFPLSWLYWYQGERVFFLARVDNTS